MTTWDECNSFYISHTKRWRALKKEEFFRLPYKDMEVLKKDFNKLMEFLQRAVVWKNTTEEVDGLEWIDIVKEILVTVKRDGNKYRFETIEEVDEEKAIEIQNGYYPVAGYGFNWPKGKAFARIWTCEASCD